MSTELCEEVRWGSESPKALPGREFCQLYSEEQEWVG